MKTCTHLDDRPTKQTTLMYNKVSANQSAVPQGESRHKLCDCRQHFKGMRGHVEGHQSGWCRVLMTSPCFCGSPASVRSPCSDSLATCSSSTRYTPAAPSCCLKTLPVWLLKTMITKNSSPAATHWPHAAHQPGTPLLLQAAASKRSQYDC